MINSLMYAFSSFGGISSKVLTRSSASEIPQAKQHSVEFSANLETMIDSGEAAKVVNIPTLGSRAERREKPISFFSLVKNIV